MKNLKDIWKQQFLGTAQTLSQMKDIQGVISAFNSNIDAICKIDGQKLQKFMNVFGVNEVYGPTEIKRPEDVIRGIYKCFASGIAEEWIIKDLDTFHWVRENLGQDKFQMGGQGGIVANAMAVCGIQNVYVHCSSLPHLQAKLFLDRSNLKSTDEEGVLRPAYQIDRSQDVPLIHWIFEFDKGDQVKLKTGDTVTCPKSNRFIACYEPPHMQMRIDQGFSNLMAQTKVDVVVLSGYHTLTTKIAPGISGQDKIDESLEHLKKWMDHSPGAIFHLELASTQDKQIRTQILSQVAYGFPSLGLNERETMDLLEVMNQTSLLKECQTKVNSTNLFKAVKLIFDETQCGRIQLHMFGLYLTILRKNFVLSPEQNRSGMVLASTIAASKAATGSIDRPDHLMWSEGMEVSDVGLKELTELHHYLQQTYGASELLESGMAFYDEFNVVAIPTILVDRPVTLVGMGDTISSVSLLGALASHR